MLIIRFRTLETHYICPDIGCHQARGRCAISGVFEKPYPVRLQRMNSLNAQDGQRQLRQVFCNPTRPALAPLSSSSLATANRPTGQIRALRTRPGQILSSR